MTAPKPEWARHAAVWIGYPSHAELWQDDLAPAREEVVAFARAVHADGRGETVILVAADPEAADDARARAPFAQVVVEPFGDIWLRDTGPIVGGDGTAHRFRFNGWGGKYDLPGDDDIGLRLARERGMAVADHDWVVEGGGARRRRHRAGRHDRTMPAQPQPQCRFRPRRGGDAAARRPWL